MRRLIVNADDFGLSPGVNAGIVRAHRHGILTSATLLANAPAFAGAAALASDNPSLGVGLHLNLVRGRPLSPLESVPELIGADGALRRFRWRKMTRPFLEQAEREYRLQFEKILAAGIAPSHIDFEKHHAWQGELYGLAARLAGEYGVPAMRTLSEPVAWAVRRMGWPGWEKACMAAILRTGFQLFGERADTALSRPDRLLGQAHIGAMDETAWLRLLANLPAGTSEIMIHPGLPDAEGFASGMGESWLTGARLAELEALLSDNVGASVRDNGIALISYRDLSNEGCGIIAGGDCG